MDTAAPARSAVPAPAGDEDPLVRAHALFLRRQDSDALPLVRTALARSPARADAWTLLGILHQRQGDAVAAEQAYREALRLRPAYADAWTNLGNLLRDRDDRRGALLAFQQAMHGAPGTPAPLYNQGVALERFGDCGGARAAFEAAVQADPRHLDARWNLALALLREGRFDEGFRAYECRFARGEPGPRPCAQPAWDGSEPAGRTILVWAEQGYGDMLQFLRFVPELARRGARVVLEVPPALARLATTVDGVDAVCVRGTAPPSFDAHVALMSLPFALRVGPDAPALRAPYLRTDEAAVAGWRERLRGRPGTGAGEVRAGLAWAGNPAARNAHERAPGLAAVLPLLGLPGLRWFSLQKGAGDAIAAHADRITDLDAQLGDFADTAAAIEALDLVVTCDTAVAHLAGALGKPTFVLLAHARDWRHGLAEDSTPWYPSMRLFRQPAPGDWGAVVAALAQALASTSLAHAPAG
jgi:Flp pilus assembly protein TadD